MAYVAIKPCKFAGQSFRIGEVVPAVVIQPGAAKNLVKMGIIAEQDGEPIESTIETAGIKEEALLPDAKVVIHAEEGDMELNLTQEGLQAIFDVLTANVSNAEPIINEMTDEDALILLHVSDSRKSVRELAETRAKALSAVQEGEESEGEE